VLLKGRIAFCFPIMNINEASSIARRGERRKWAISRRESSFISLVAVTRIILLSNYSVAR